MSSPVSVASCKLTITIHSSSHIFLHRLPASVQQNVLQNYRKFLFVRHPFERVLSAYLNKFVEPPSSLKMMQREFGTQIIRYYRPNATRTEIEEGNDVSLLEFIQYLTEPSLSLSRNDGEHYNEHWEPINNICNPCAIQYDFIGHYENMSAESNAILKALTESKFEFPNGIRRPDNTWTRIKTAFDDIPIKYIRSLRKIYHMDLELFNYTAHEALDKMLVD